MAFAFSTNNPALAAGQLIDVGGVALRLRVNPRATRVSLRVDAARREIVATAPSTRRLKDAIAFAGERLIWMQGQLAILPAPTTLAPGSVIEVLGRPCRLQSVERRAQTGLFEEAGELRIAALGEGDIFATRVMRALKQHALKVLADRSRVHAAALGRPMPSVSLTDAKSRWGSCKPPRPGEAGVLRYSWRLVLAPDWVADYVAAHECAHLIEANHGPRFWALVHALVGSERAARAWLRTHGARLQGIGRGA